MRRLRAACSPSATGADRGTRSRPSRASGSSRSRALRALTARPRGPRPSGNDDLVGQDPRRLLRDAPARVADEAGDEQRRHRVEQRDSPTRRRAARRAPLRSSARRCACAWRRRAAPRSSAARPSRISYATTNRLTTSVTAMRPMPSGKTRGVPPLTNRSAAARQHFDQHDDQEDQDAERGHRLVLAMAVRMVGVRRPARDRDADQRDDVRRRVGQRVEAVGEDRDRAGVVAQERSWRPRRRD